MSDLRHCWPIVTFPDDPPSPDCDETALALPLDRGGHGKAGSGAKARTLPSAYHPPPAHRGGLEFGDYEEPDYWDFVHFAIVLGATAQTADIVIRSKEMRRVGTFHTLVAFGFNTAILATMINLAASLF